MTVINNCKISTSYWLSFPGNQTEAECKKSKQIMLIYMPYLTSLTAADKSAEKNFGAC